MGEPAPPAAHQPGFASIMTQSSTAATDGCHRAGVTSWEPRGPAVVALQRNPSRRLAEIVCHRHDRGRHGAAEVRRAVDVCDRRLEACLFVVEPVV